MPADLNALRELIAERSDEAFPLLVTIEHSSLSEPIRLAGWSAVDIVSLGQTYYAAPNLHPKLPTQEPDSVPQGSLALGLVDPDLLARVRALRKAATVDLVLVRESQPDTAQAQWLGFRWVSSDSDGVSLVGNLRAPQYASNRIPAERLVESNFPLLRAAGR